MSSREAICATAAHLHTREWSLALLAHREIPSFVLSPLYKAKCFGLCSDMLLSLKAFLVFRLSLQKIVDVAPLF